MIRIQPYIRIVTHPKLDIKEFDVNPSIQIKYTVFKLEEFILNGKDIELFYQCECKNFGGSTFLAPEDKTIPDNIIQEMIIHTNFKHCE